MVISMTFGIAIPLILGGGADMPQMEKPHQTFYETPERVAAARRAAEGALATDEIVALVDSRVCFLKQPSKRWKGDLSTRDWGD